LFDNDFPKFVWNSKNDQLDRSLIPKVVRNYYIKVCNEFAFDRTYFQYLKPVQHIQYLIDREVKCFPKKIIGVHIRRTDNAKSIDESPLHLFVERMRQDLSYDSDIHYFLATDDPSVEAELLVLFPLRVLCLKKEFRRDSKDGIIGAMVDLYCLAATSKIYGSFWSSFSSVAARIGDIPLIVIKN
jgi:hypothetical protein